MFKPKHFKEVLRDKWLCKAHGLAITDQKTYLLTFDKHETIYGDLFSVCVCEILVSVHGTPQA